MDDRTLMDRALHRAASTQGLTAPNPWVGAVLALPDGRVIDGITHPPGGPHAEAHALAQVDGNAEGASLYVTLEPCAHQGRTGPCTEAIIAAGVRRVVVAIADPDPLVAGRGLERLAAAGLQVEVGLGAERATELLAAYLHHRSTGRPYVVLKLAATLDGRTAAPDTTSQWITGAAARADVHRLRAQCDAILVGAGTVRADDPSLTVRNVESPLPGVSFDPLRVVLGSAPSTAKVRPCLELDGPLPTVLDELGQRGVVQLLVEGGATVAGEFHRMGLVNRYVIYLAPALFGGDDARPMLAGPAAPTIADLWRGQFHSVERLGEDLRIEVRPTSPTQSSFDNSQQLQEATS